jgi:Rieske Fe-S protein
MRITRREFLILTATVAGGCASLPNGAVPAQTTARTVNAGPVANYAADGIYSAFRHQGFFIVRQGADFFAISSVCTHRKCTLDAEANRSFSCPCHGSTFDLHGRVTEGPARRDLPILATSVNADGHLLVTF